MEIYLAKSAGFCFGVTRAVDMVNSLVGEEIFNIYTFGPIIHNEQVVKGLEGKGVTSCEDLKKIELPAKMVIRAHGVKPSTYKPLREMGVEIYDATCPYVKKIHNLVKEKGRLGYKIVIIGNESHPEDVGIKGWCENNSVVVEGISNIDVEELSDKKVCVVAQTTLSYTNWEETTKFLKKSVENIEIYDTICSATSKRQKEAEEISKNVDAMFVIGSLNSSNTQKLFQICKANCKNTYQIEIADDFDYEFIKNKTKIGITAGASTPELVIEEVIDKMHELGKEYQEQEMDFGKILEDFEDSLKEIRSGDVVNGRIIGFNNNEVFVDIGYKSDGVISADEFSSGDDLESDLKVGDEIEVYVARVNDVEGIVTLSRKKALARRVWNDVEKYYNDKTQIDTKVTEIVKGGVLCEWKGARIFVPASQISDRFIKSLDDFKGKELRVRIIEFNQKNRRLIGSQRVILEEERKMGASHVWDNIEIGKEYKGVVKNITKFGAFVDIGGVDGLIHISDLSWKKIGHPSEILESGEQIDVSVKDFDKEKGKISFTYRKSEDDPWVKEAANLSVDQIVEAKVVRLVPFGAFVEIMPGVEGLVHISQIAEKRIARPSEVLKEGQIVEAKISDIDLNARKIGLSIKNAKEADLEVGEEQVVSDGGENDDKANINEGVKQTENRDVDGNKEDS